MKWINYYGGKSRLASQVVSEIKRISHTVFVEPYCGGCAVLFAKAKPAVTNNDHYREVINDIDERLITLYRVARTQPETFYHWVQTTPYSQAECKRSAEILKNSEGYSELERAWAYYVNISQSFANNLLTGWGTGVFGRNLAATWRQRQLGLGAALDRLSDVHVSCEPALRCIERWDSSHTLYYVDPPYPATNQGHYKGFTLDDWQQLCDKLDNIQGSYILSNYTQAIEPKSAQRKVEIKSTMSAANGKHRTDKERTEVLWICDRSAAIRSELSFCRYQQHSLFDAG